MTYYKVKPQYADRTRYMIRRGKKVCDSCLVAHELYTPGEFKRIANNQAWFDKVDVPKSKVYFCFGARFAE